MEISYPILNPQTLEEDPSGARYKKTVVGESTILEFWGDYVMDLIFTNDKVVAKVYDYQDEFQQSFFGMIIFECEGVEQTAQAVNGIATIDIIVEAGTQAIVKTVNANFRNGEVIINA